MRSLIFIHRWLGVLFCLFFAMWFASGVVMHFVPFPALTEPERFAGLAPLDFSRTMPSPAAAVAASDLKNVTRVRLVQRSDGPVYVVSDETAIKALHAASLAPAAIDSPSLSLAIVLEHARQRGLYAAHAAFVERAMHDQWTVPNGLDPHRPLFRIALNDTDGTELYVSSTTGEIVRDTTRFERAWNYVGSVVHWIYPTVLRKDRQLWADLVWWMSLVAMIATIVGIVVGVGRLKKTRWGVRSPYRRWHAWHHWLGLASTVFVTTWIVSGWLSLDQGRLFSEGQATTTEAERIIGAPAWQRVSAAEQGSLLPSVREIEWFVLGGRIYRRERAALDMQRLTLADPLRERTTSEFLASEEVDAVMRRLDPTCQNAAVVDPEDDYAIESRMPHAPVYRVACPGAWYHVDGATGAILDKLDPSRRAYRWAYSALHTFDFPALMARPMLRTVLVVALCAIGFVFSITGVVIGWRRLRLQFY